MVVRRQGRAWSIWAGLGLLVLVLLIAYGGSVGRIPGAQPSPSDSHDEPNPSEGERVEKVPEGTDETTPLWRRDDEVPDGQPCEQEGGSPDAVGSGSLGSPRSRGHVLTYVREGEVQETAIDLLSSYRDQGDCVLAGADYLDLFGSVWGCVIHGGNWVDVCMVSRLDGQDGSQVSILRLDGKEASEIVSDLDDMPIGEEEGVSDKDGGSDVEEKP